MKVKELFEASNADVEEWKSGMLEVINKGLPAASKLFTAKKLDSTKSAKVSVEMAEAVIALFKKDRSKWKVLPKKNNIITIEIKGESDRGMSIRYDTSELCTAWFFEDMA